MTPRFDPDYPISFIEACRNTFIPVKGRGRSNGTERYQNLNAYTLPAVVSRRIVMALTDIRSKRTISTKFRIVLDPAGRKGVLKTDLIRWFSDIKVFSNPPTLGMHSPFPDKS